MQPAPKPTCSFELSKQKIQVLEMLELCPTIVLSTYTIQMSLSPIGFLGRSSDFVFDRTGEG